MTVAGSALVAGLCTLIAVTACCLAVAFARGWKPGAGRPPRRSGRGQKALEQLPDAWRERYRPLLVVGAAAGLLVWVITGWPVHGLVTAAAVAALPFVLHPGGSPKARIETLEALSDWLHQLAGVHVAGLSLEQTVRSSAKSAPAAVREQVQQLTTRLERGWPAEEAYRALADDLDDGMVDHAVLLLQSHARDRGPGLSKALEALAESLSQQTKDAREVEADRAKVRASARWISLFVLGVVTVLMINKAYTAPYGTPQGQLLLAVLGGMFGFLLLRMHKMARPAPQPRLLTPAAARNQSGAGARTPGAPAEDVETAGAKR